MLIGGIVVFCILLLVLAFLLPRLSRPVEKGGSGVLGLGQRSAGQAPGKLGRWLAKPFGKSRKAVNKSGAAGRRGRAKAPF